MAGAYGRRDSALDNDHNRGELISARGDNPMRLQFCTWPEVERYLERSRGIIIPIGSTEQHGPMGLCGTDALCPEVVATAAAESLDVLIGPTLSVGMAQHHLAFPGSITLRPTTLIAVIEDYVRSLAKAGFERFYFLNGHGGNIATVQAAFAQIYSAASLSQSGAESPLRCRLANWFAFSEVQTLIKQLFGDQEGSHATPSEVSVTQYAYPEHIKRMAATPAAPVSFAFTDADDFRRLFPDGRMGSESALATPEAGARLVERAAACVVSDYQRFVV